MIVQVGGSGPKVQGDKRGEKEKTIIADKAVLNNRFRANGFGGMYPFRRNLHRVCLHDGIAITKPGQRSLGSFTRIVWDSMGERRKMRLSAVTRINPSSKEFRH